MLAVQALAEEAALVAALAAVVVGREVVGTAGAAAGDHQEGEVAMVEVEVEVEVEVVGNARVAGA